MIVLMLVADKTSESSEVETLMDAQKVGTSLRDNINMINEEGPGYFAYFYLPDTIQGGYDYNIVISNNVIDLAWEENAWSTKVVPTNVTVFCLSKGLSSPNRIFYGPSGIEITCDLPNLKPLPQTLRLYQGSTSVDVYNDAPADAPSFSALMLTNSTPSSAVVALPGLAAGQTATIKFPLGAKKFVYVYVDYLNQVNESVKSDNTMNVTL